MKTWTLTNKCKLIISLLAVFQTQVCLACFDEREENAPKISHQAAVNFPYQMGFLISETSEVGSCVFLNERTALTSMHLGMLHNENEKQLVVATNEVKLPLDTKNQIDFFGVMKNIEKGTASSYDVHFLGKMEEIPVKNLDNVEELNLNTSSTQSEIENSISCQVEFELKAKPEDFLSIQTIIVKGKKFKLIGSDLAVLKLKKPIENLKKTVRLQDLEPQKIKDLPVYAGGFSAMENFSNGKSTLFLKDNCPLAKSLLISCPKLEFFEKTNSFYATYLSPNAQDNRFTIQERLLPQTEEEKIYGRIVGGMSGGPLFVKEGEDCKLCGIVSQTYSSQLIQFLEAHTESNSKVLRKVVNKYLKKLRGKEMLTLDVYQSFSKEDLKQIRELMAVKN